MSEVQTAPESNVPLLQQQQQSGAGPLVQSLALAQSPGEAVVSSAARDVQKEFTFRHGVLRAFQRGVDSLDV